MENIKYYGTQQVNVIKDIDEVDCVVEMLIGEYGQEDDGYYNESWSEPYFTRLVLKKSDLFDKPLNSDDIIKERLKMIKSAEVEIKQMKNNANKQIREEYTELNNKIRNIKKDAKKIEYLEDYIKIITGEYKWFVYESSGCGHHYGINKFDEVYCSYDEDELAAVSYRLEKYKQGKIYISQYSDDSGSKYQVIPFKTLDEAKDYFIKAIESDKIKINDYIVKECVKYNITTPKVDKFKFAIQKKNEAAKLKKKKELEKELAKLSE